MSKWIITAVVLLGAVLVAWVWEVSRKRRIASRMADRKPLQDASFEEAYFPPQQADIATRLRQILSRELGVESL